MVKSCSIHVTSHPSPWQSHEIPLKSHEIPWNPMEIPWKSHEIPWKSHQIPWNPQSARGRKPSTEQQLPTATHPSPVPPCLLDLPSLCETYLGSWRPQAIRGDHWIARAHASSCWFLARSAASCSWRLVMGRSKPMFSDFRFFFLSGGLTTSWQSLIFTLWYSKDSYGKWIQMTYDSRWFSYDPWPFSIFPNCSFTRGQNFSEFLCKKIRTCWVQLADVAPLSFIPSSLGIPTSIDQQNSATKMLLLFGCGSKWKT